MKINIISGAKNISEQLKFQSKERPEEISETSYKDKLFYIYTSGTTGLPKAAVITNMRFLFFAVASKTLIGLQKDDVLYNPLPMYHSAGGILGTGNTLIFGNTTALRKRFSASNYWTDCIKYKCTAVQYIGEICRFLLAQPKKPQEIQHKIRLMFGNGIRPEIWEEFIERFNIPKICEIYGSTEGNSTLCNITGKVGVVGFVPRFATFFYPLMLIRCDEQTGEPIRGQNGLCIRCKPGERGIMMGKINQDKAVVAFAGYSDKVT